MSLVSCERAVIGVLPLIDYERESLWMLPEYMEGILQSGAIPYMLPLTDDINIIRQIAGELDGFLFTGGHDVAPSVYGEEALSVCGECSPQRDNLERVLLEIALGLDMPVLGICRGIQFFNAALGGSLYQDLPTQRSGSIEHHQSPPYSVPCHNVKLVVNSPLHCLLGIDNMAVNSYHHQAIKALSPQLLPMAYSEDGLIEAVYCPDKGFTWAVQWHPEFSFTSDENSKKIFSAFTLAAKEYRNQK